MPPALLLVGDLHVNHQFGLMPPSVVLDSGNEIKANKFQRWLWQRWLDLCAEMDGYNVEGIIVNGDLPHGINAHKDSQVLTINEADEIRFTEAVLQPLLYAFTRDAEDAVMYGERRAAKLFVTRGTGFHVGHAGSREEIIARHAGAVPDEHGICSRFEWWIDWRGKLIHATHHTSTASVFPLTPLVRQLNNARVRAQIGWLMPDIIVRSHIHKCHFLEANDNRMIMTLPAWQLATEFSHKVAPGDIPDIGGVILWLDEASRRVQARRILFPLPLPEIVKA